MTVTNADALAFYARIGAALFPIPAGKKDPTGIIASFAHDWSCDPAQWTAWRTAHPGCNFGLVAGPSRLIILDIDTSGGPEGRDEAWALWCALCTEWGIPPAGPHVQSARGGWHVLFAVPSDVDAAALRQPDAVKKRINVRAGNGYVVAAGSYYDGTAKGEASGHYILMTDAAPYPAPAALVAHCTRSAAPATPAPNLGTRDIGDTAALISWLAERNAFAAYEDWLGAGMALKLEFGDAGLDVWRLAHDETVTPDVEATKWRSFAAEPQPGAQTLNSLLDRAHKLGWRGTVRKSTAALFAGAAVSQQVAALAAGAGATLPGAVPMLAGQEELCRVAAPILDDFLALPDLPIRPLTNDYPNLPDACSGHGLFTPLRTAVDRIIAAGERDGAKWKGVRFSDALSVLSLVHADTFDAVARKLRGWGCAVPDSKIRLGAAAIADKVERAFVPTDGWILDARTGFPENDNSDNVGIFLAIIGAEIRWNAWLERAEIRGATNDQHLNWRDWTYIDDTVVAKLRTRGNRTKTRFKPAKEFFWESLLALAQQSPFDPVLDRLAELQSAWDGQPRLSLWLARACGVPCDPYHQAVGRSIVGGLVRRARKPGCKHDEVAVFYGPQGTGKSTLARIIADTGLSTLTQITKQGTDWFSDEIMLGDASKELVLSLAGKMVIEIAEMGMRGSANTAHVKAMLSRQIDRGRTAYARAVTERPRRNVFIGTTNENEPLTDPTGNRRFLPVHIVNEIDLQWLLDNVAQIIGEAAHLESQGASFTLPREVWSVAAEHQEAARVESDVEVLLNDWFTETSYTQLAYITAADLVHLSMLAGFRGNTARGEFMKRLGFRSETPYIGGKKVRVWVRGRASLPTHIEREGVRYVVGAHPDGRPRVTIQMGGALPK